MRIACIWGKKMWLRLKSYCRIENHSRFMVKINQVCFFSCMCEQFYVLQLAQSVWFWCVYMYSCIYMYTSVRWCFLQMWYDSHVNFKKEYPNRKISLDLLCKLTRFLSFFLSPPSLYIFFFLRRFFGALNHGHVLGHTKKVLSKRKTNQQTWTRHRTRHHRQKLQLHQDKQQNSKKAAHLIIKMVSSKIIATIEHHVKVSRKIYIHHFFFFIRSSFFLLDWIGREKKLLFAVCLTWKTYRALCVSERIYKCCCCDFLCVVRRSSSISHMLSRA